MAQKTEKKQKQFPTDETSPYSYLVINKALKNILYILIAIMTVVLSSIIYAEMNKGTHWFIIAIFSMIAGSVLVAYPQTEHWVYRPWQNSSQRMERMDGR